jgi:tRNA threonylcarbamoyl adenosine modification protein YeaZ
MTASTPWLLALDTSTNTIVVAAGTPSGALIDAEILEGRHRHSQELLPAVLRLVERAGLGLTGLGGVVVGTGPGAFTGLRVGLATAKTLAHELRVPIVGIASSDALLAGIDRAATLWLPSGPRDRVAVSAGSEPVVVSADDEVPGDLPTTAIAVDLDGRATVDALELGRTALAALPASLLRLGAARLAAGDADDPERIVPRYASAPRGASAGQADGGVAWSRDPR